MPTEPTVNVLLNRFSQEAKSVFYPFLVVSSDRRLWKTSLCRGGGSVGIDAVENGIVSKRRRHDDLSSTIIRDWIEPI